MIKIPHHLGDLILYMDTLVHDSCMMSEKTAYYNIAEWVAIAD
jgi:hypothetical protein